MRFDWAIVSFKKRTLDDKLNQIAHSVRTIWESIIVVADGLQRKAKRNATTKWRDDATDGVRLDRRSIHAPIPVFFVRIFISSAKEFPLFWVTVWNDSDFHVRHKPIRGLGRLEWKVPSLKSLDVGLLISIYVCNSQPSGFGFIEMLSNIKLFSTTAPHISWKTFLTSVRNLNSSTILQITKPIFGFRQSHQNGIVIGNTTDKLLWK